MSTQATVLTKIQITSLESAGTLKLSGADVTLNQEILVADIGNLVFTPAQDANGTGYDSLDFKVHDGTEYSAAANTITVDVTAVQDAPTAADKTVTTNEDTAYTFAAADFGFSRRGCRRQPDEDPDHQPGERRAS